MVSTSARAARRTARRGSDVLGGVCGSARACDDDPEQSVPSPRRAPSKAYPGAGIAREGGFADRRESPNGLVWRPEGHGVVDREDIAGLFGETDQMLDDAGVE